MTGLIKTIWTSLSTLWTNHLNHVHQKADNIPSPEKRLEMQTKIRMLHQRRQNCLAAHRERYFHDDLDDYLAQATNSQMETYITNYEPRIYDSIKQSQNNDTLSSILAHNGFTRTAPSGTNRPRSLANSDVPIHPKHSRWRPTSTIVDRFCNFFKPTQTTQTN